MSYSINTSFVQSFDSTVHMIGEQDTSRLINAVTVESNMVGDKAYQERSGTIVPRKITDRHAATVLDTLDLSRRRISTEDYALTQLVAPMDLPKLLIDPAPLYQKIMANAIARLQDQVIITAFGASAYGGTDGETATVFDANNVVPVNLGGSSEGLTLKKMLRAMKILMKNEPGSMAQFFFALSAQQIEDVLQIATFTSSDYNGMKPLMDGKLGYYNGFTIIRSELLPLSSGDIRTCYAWVKSGMKFRWSRQPQLYMGPRADLNNDLQIQYQLGLGATRMEEAKVVSILCDESP